MLYLSFFSDSSDSQHRTQSHPLARRILPLSILAQPVSIVIARVGRVGEALIRRASTGKLDVIIHIRANWMWTRNQAGA